MTSGGLYEVAVRARGRREAEADVEDLWITVTRRPIGLSRAKRLADSLTVHAAVTRWGFFEIVHENGKAPRLLEGWVAP